MWGFLTCLNDILVPHLKSIFDLSYAQVMLVQFAFFSAYFLFSVPWSRIVNAIGYQRTMVVGLLTMACGAYLFVPAASAASYPLFLTALLVLAAGITGLQVSANPYVDLLAKERHGRRTSVNRCFSQRKCRRGAQEDHCAFHCFDTSSADMTELSEACTVLGA